jgi:hypothetical protein
LQAQTKNGPPFAQPGRLNTIRLVGSPLVPHHQKSDPFPSSFPSPPGPQKGLSVHKKRNNCSEANFDQQNQGFSETELWLNPEKPATSEQRRQTRQLAHTAFRFGHHEIGSKLLACSTDGVVFQRPDGTYGMSPMFCGHRLCPLCARLKTSDLRNRMNHVTSKARTFATLTFRTDPDDQLLGDYLTRSQKALRLLISKRHASDWLPFGDGYLWKCEVTDSLACFHPHYHVLSTEAFIPIDRLTDRWRDACATHGLDAQICWVRPVNRNALMEMSKYLAKGLKSVHPRRWQDLNDGLRNKRAYGSGGTLRLPPADAPPGYKLIGFLSNYESNPVILEAAKINRWWNDIDQTCSLAVSMRKRLHYDSIQDRFLARASSRRVNSPE